jgi:hypothetical protein
VALAVQEGTSGGGELRSLGESWGEFRKFWWASVKKEDSHRKIFIGTSCSLGLAGVETNIKLRPWQWREVQITNISQKKLVS